MDPYAVRWGERVPPPERFTVGGPGPTTATVAGAAIERLRHGAVTVLCGLAVVVRDRNWNTVPAEVLARSRAGERLELRVRHARGEIDFEWSGVVEVTPGRLTAEFDGFARADFHRNRIGWCLLHPLELAGVAVEVEGPDGRRRPGRFPERISPHQPLRSIRALTYEAAGVTVRIELDGDEFETEDQRNWTDASYKTYSTPLDLPFPVLVRTGERISQRVEVTMAGAPATTPSPGPERIELGAWRPMPQLGLSYPLHRELDPAERRHVTEALPDFVYVELDAADAGWPARLNVAAREAAAVALPLDVAVVAESRTQLEPVLAAIRDPTNGVREIGVFDATSHLSTPELVDLARETLPDMPLLGGTRAHFAELNRATDLPVDHLSSVGYSVTPQMHADDRATVRDNLLAQPHTVRDAAEIAAGRQVVVGPVGFRPRFNAVATAPEPPPAADELPREVDARQASVFGAAWTVGALAGLAGADRLILGDVVGRRGIAGRVDEPPHPAFPGLPGESFPVWAVLAALRATRKAGDAEIAVALAPAGTAAVRVRRDGAECLLVANLRDEPITLEPLVSWPSARLLAADPTAPRGWSVTRTDHWTLPAPAVLLLSTHEEDRDG